MREKHKWDATTRTLILVLAFIALLSCSDDSGISGNASVLPVKTLSDIFANPDAIQYYQDSQTVFDDSRIHTVNITIRQSYLLDMVKRSVNSARYDEHLWMPGTVIIDGDTALDNVGIRIKGNTSRDKPKKSFKLKFNEQDLYTGNANYIQIPSNQGRRYRGLKRINLRGSTTDNAFIHDKAGYWLYKQMGYPSPRVSYTKVFITEITDDGTVLRGPSYLGLFLLTEDLDKTFVKSYFKNDTGNLYKVTGGGDLTDPGVDLKNYTWDDEGKPQRCYRLKTNEETDDYSDLSSFIQTANNDWNNIDSLMSFRILALYFAIDNIQGNWDEYIFIKNNYYMYFCPSYGFVMLPWDVENNFNMGDPEWGFPAFDSAPLLNGLKETLSWGSSDVPLWDNSITDNRFTTQYINYCKQVAALLPQLAVKINEWTSLIQTAATTSSTNLDYGEDYITPGIHTTAEPFNEGIGFNEEKQRVLNFLSSRKTFIDSNY